MSNASNFKGFTSTNNLILLPICRRAVATLFEAGQGETPTEKVTHFAVKVSYVEIYNENVYGVLSIPTINQ